MCALVLLTRVVDGLLVTPSTHVVTPSTQIATHRTHSPCMQKRDAQGYLDESELTDWTELKTSTALGATVTEWKDLPPWLENVCTDQILVEIHTGTGKFPCDPDPAGTELSRVLRFHHLFALLDAHGYSQFFYEPNVRKARYCGEYAFVRRMPCDDRYHTDYHTGRV